MSIVFCFSFLFSIFSLKTILSSNYIKERMINVHGSSKSFGDAGIAFHWKFYDETTNSYSPISEMKTIFQHQCLINKISKFECSQVVDNFVERMNDIKIGEPYEQINNVIINESFSQVGQDRWVINYYNGKRGGVFVDIGAQDGISYSNSFMLERFFDWSGLLIEPRLENFKSLYSNRSSKVFPYCAYNKTAMFDFYDISKYAPSSIINPDMLSGVVETYLTNSFDWVDENSEKYKLEKKIKSMPCYHIQEILDEHNIKHIDYLSIDVEGADITIIKAINFDKVNITVMHIESGVYDDRIELYNYLSRKGYKVTQLGHDMCFYKPQI